MKKYVFLSLILVLVRNSLSQSTDIFDESYFVNTISELLDNNIDSIKLYSGIDSINIHPEPFYTYFIEKHEENTYITKRSSLFHFFDQKMFSTQVYTLNKFLEIEEVLATGVQSGVILNNTTNRKIIDYKKGKINMITEIRNNFSDTTITNFNYFGDLVWKVNIQSNRSVEGENILTNKVIYIEYYRNGEILKTIKE